MNVDRRMAQKLVASGRFIENLGFKRPQIVEHYFREINTYDGHASITMGDGGSRSANTDSSVERAVHAREQIDLELADIQAGERLLLITIADLTVSYDRFLGIRLPEIDDERKFDKCSGTITEGCTEHAGDHHDPETQSLIDNLCSGCFAKACQVCYIRKAEDRRVDGRRACGACYRRDLRNKHNITAA